MSVSDQLWGTQVNVFDKAIETGVQRFIRIECPGIVEEEIEWQELPNGVKAGPDLHHPR